MDKALTPHLELPISEFHGCINAFQQYMHQSHDWEQTAEPGSIPGAGEIFHLGFFNILVL
jgi:hypothetical protein